MTQHLITTTMEPDRIYSVNDQELCDLERMGVVCTRVPTRWPIYQEPALDQSTTSPTRQEETTDGGSEEDQPETDGGKAAKATGK